MYRSPPSGTHRKKTVMLQLRGLIARGSEHYFYDKANKYTAVFWGLTKEQFNDPSLSFDLISVDEGENASPSQRKSRSGRAPNQATSGLSLRKAQGIRPDKKLGTRFDTIFGMEETHGRRALETGSLGKPKAWRPNRTIPANGRPGPSRRRRVRVLRPPGRSCSHWPGR